MGYAILHLEKASASDSGMSAHIERSITPKNVDPERTHLNREMIEFPKEVSNRTEAIQKRLDTANLQRKIGKNQVRAIRILLSGSPEDMKNIEQCGNLNKWCNDNLKWLSNTYGEKNIVSAVLHLDETTPHIHATMIPIVTGERRKTKTEPTTAKKKYRKKSTDTARLCADDVMSRIKLKEYQNTYAEAMAKFGLKRGIEGSEAKHISTSQYYRDTFKKTENLQKKIASSEQKLAEIKSDTSKELFKNKTAEVGNKILDGMNSVLGTSKIKKLNQEITSLKNINQKQSDNIITMKNQLNEKLKIKETAYQEALGNLKKKEKQWSHVCHLFPIIQKILVQEQFCRKLGFSKEICINLARLKPVKFSGEIYSIEFQRNFKTTGSIAKIEPITTDSDTYHLTIDDMNHVKWFRMMNDKDRQQLGIKLTPRKGKDLSI